MSNVSRVLLSRGARLAVSQRRFLNKKVGIVGVPFSLGQSRLGVSGGPKALRDAGIVKTIQELGCTVHDYGDLDFPTIEGDEPWGNLKYPRSNGAANKKISEMINKSLNENEMTLTLGGDHSLSCGTMHGHASVEPDVCLIWVDAHADINTPLTSPSGHFHGMPLSMLVHELKDYIPYIPGFEWLKPCISARSIAYIGLRELDPGELYIVRKYGISCFTMHEVDRLGIHQVLERSMEVINPHGNKPIHLSFDIDSLDPGVASATGTPVPGGLTVREGIYIAEEVAKTGKLRALDVVEVNPDIGSDLEKKLTLFSGVNIIQACFGKKREGYIPSGFTIPKPDKKMYPE